MSQIDRALENDFRSHFARTDSRAIPLPLSAEDMTEFVDEQTKTKLAAWAATTQLGLRHKLTDMAIQAVK